MIQNPYAIIHLNLLVFSQGVCVMYSKKTEILASLGLLSAAIIWGFAFVVVKNSLDLIPPIYMLAFRFTIAAIPLALILHKRLRRLSKNALKGGLIIGFYLFIAHAVQTIGCQYTTAGKNAFLTTIYVILVPFMHWIFNKKRPDKISVIGAFIAIIGIGLLSLQGESGINLGDFLTILCGILFSIHIIYIDRYTQTEDPLVITVLQMAFAALFSWIAAPLLNGGFPTAVFQIDILSGMLYLGLMSSMLGFLLQTVGQKYTAPSTASLLLSFESVFGVLFSAIFLRESMTLRMILGCILMFFAVILVETRFSFITKHFSKSKQKGSAS